MVFIMLAILSIGSRNTNVDFQVTDKNMKRVFLLSLVQQILYIQEGLLHSSSFE